ncbi:MAG: hypothetical protein ACK5MY_15675 [Jhaorihella sp.]
MPNTFFQNTTEAAAFGLFCAHADGHRAVLHLDQIASDLTIPGTDLRTAFASLAERGLVDLLQDTRKPGRIIVEFADPETFDAPSIPPAAYFTAAKEILAARRDGAEEVL